MPVIGPGKTGSFTLSSTAATQLSNANEGRTYLLITNNDVTYYAYVAFDVVTPTSGNYIPIPPGGNLEIGPVSAANNIPMGPVYAIAAAGSPVISYTEA